MASKRIVILFDMAISPPEDHDYSKFQKDVSWEAEQGIFKAIKELGHEPIFLGVFDDADRLVKDLARIKPDLVFNQCCAFKGRRDYEPQIAGVLELLEIPFTGTPSLGLSLCQDKNLCKKILSHHHIRVPKWTLSKKENPIRGLKNFAFPAFVKPSREEGSEGISLDSFVESEKDALERVHFLHERYKSDVIIEEFVPGREFYVSVIGAKRLQVLPIRELTFREYPEDTPRFATYKAKWDPEYRKRWGIRNEFAKGLSETEQNEAERIVKKAFEVLEIGAFARFDLRLSQDGQLVMLEANPNPSLSPWDDFAQSCQKAGMDFKSMIEKIIHLS